MIRLGCLGYGVWGRNVARVAASTPGASLVAIAELQEDRRTAIGSRHPGVEVYENEDALLARPDLDAILVVSDAATHSGLVERVAAAAVREAGKLLFVGHLMRYNPAVELLFAVAREELGPIRCVAAQRLNFGKVRHDENVLFSLGPHDLSIMLELFGERPVSVAAQGAAFVREGVEDLCFVTLRFPGGRIGQMHLSWLDPHKVRRVTVVGETKMAVFDDMEPREKVRIYDQRVEPPDGGGFWTYGENLSMRSGEIRAPSFVGREPLAVEMEHFIDCIANGREPRTGADEGIAVVDLLAAAQQSMRSGGRPVELS